MSADMDVTEFASFSRDLGKIAPEVGGNVVKALAVTGKKTQDAWRERAAGAYGAPAYARSISYDIGVEASGVLSIASTLLGGSGAGVISVEIGPDKNRAQGSLGNLIEYGSVNNSPKGYGLAAAQENEDDFNRGLDIAVKDAEKAVGI